MIGYEFIVMSLIVGACLVLMPYVIKKIESVHLTIEKS